LETRVTASKVPGLRALLVSSAPLDVSLARTFEDQTAIPLVQGWGLSEYTNFACCLSPALPAQERRSLLLDGELTSVGSPLEGTEVTVIDGELCVRGPSRMLGYFKDEAATQATVDADGWLHTGDEGHAREHAAGAQEPPPVRKCRGAPGPGPHRARRLTEPAPLTSRARRGSGPCSRGGARRPGSRWPRSWPAPRSAGRSGGARRSGASPGSGPAPRCRCQRWRAPR